MPTFLDIETIFREPSRVGLEKAYPQPKPGSDPVQAAEVLGTQKAVDALLKEKRPDLVTLQMMAYTESQHKNRSGVQELLHKEMAKYIEDAIPHKVKMIPECCEIIAVGFGDNVFTGTEKSILEDTWDAWASLKSSQKPYGWRLATFDVPVLIAASALNGVTMPDEIYIASKYNYDGFVDMATKRSWDGRLRDICLATGFSGDANDPLGTGGAVAKAYDEGRMEDIVKHCQVDLERCEHIHSLYEGYLW